MDLLCHAYGASSDEEEDKKLVGPVPPPKRFKPADSYQRFQPAGSIDQKLEPPIPGRYVSKRERMLSSSRVTCSNTPSNAVTSPVVGSISDSDIPFNVLPSLKSQATGRTQLGIIPESLSINLTGHIKAVNAIQWSPTHAHLLASAGMDQTACVWNVWSKGQRKARVLEYHNAAIKDLRWSPLGLSLLTCGYDCCSRLVDVEKGLQTQVFKEDQAVGSVRFHPENFNLFLSGGSKGFLKLWDIRAGQVVQQYLRGLGPILDIDFSVDAKCFISSSDVSKGNVSENSIIVWSLLRQVPLSNQVYVEAYTCPCVKYHAFDSTFIAQSNGNYIAIFSSKPPFKMDRYKRYEKHAVSGFPIRCNFSLDGKILVSGSADGNLYFYSYDSSELLRKVKAFEQPCIDVSFHPSIPNVVAACSWNGDLVVFE